jgi:ribosomal protein L40E
MADFLESAKSMVSAAVSRTSWEAQKQLRVRSKQGEIDKLLEQRQQLLDELGQVAMNLYQQGRLTDQQLSRLCASIQELDHDVQNREVQLQQVKSEVYPASQFAPSSTPDYTPPVSSSPASQASNAGAQPQLCPTCGSTIRPNALYCRSCGTKLR